MIIGKIVIIGSGAYGKLREKAALWEMHSAQNHDLEEILPSLADLEKVIVDTERLFDYCNGNQKEYYKERLTTLLKVKGYIQKVRKSL